MEHGPTSARRRLTLPRSGRDPRPGEKSRAEAAPSPDMLRQWRRALTDMESQAGRYRLGEVKMLLGVVALAIDDAIKSRPI